MSEDDYYAKLDRLDEQARKERAEMLQRHADKQAELDRRAIEQGMTEKEHFRLLDEQREADAREHQEVMDRLARESDERDRQAAEAAQREMEKRTAAAQERQMQSELLAQSREEQKAREIEATIEGIDDPEMSPYLAGKRREIEERYAEQQREREALDQHERNARDGDLQLVTRAQADKAEQEKLDRELGRNAQAAKEALAKVQARAEKEIADKAERQIHLIEMEKSIREEKERLDRIAREEAERRRIRNYEYTRD